MEEAFLRIFILNESLDPGVQIDMANLLGFDIALSEFKDDMTIVYAFSNEAMTALPTLRFFKKMEKSPTPDTWVRIGSMERTLNYLMENNQVTEIFRQT
ncbi:MAG: hypothetical protein UW35_C0012G0016 [Candidatus Collierbacteria bacterium GW2011_GWF2_44_15]|uniref:Uncharacterized protein n=4 Tax=Candidatus Collieribacteriota TaxID=1752725 RepID=A0A0G1HIX0_9BACT|nr:MAG: hypothetical protein UW23_C0005G0014 [Candidatus Collierbacteria bacterium GW2011_GWA1_44_12]KKT38925.1 MAG: hypothetical protein UW26_C0010G0019 [Candidatus Collierbacteria bacterium GW2011_GWF1_44_12]KKT46543.1 MAG: hypothetical protein UW35_C0012G0016 [Candidatus Collierbacteria bacterium GW2011_GWF2_44_15]KKU27773.1 MAG: hypothetical protein UX41_C0043G0004 [Candidatus Collierbacteria bacterium GW2011_GWE1_46_18]